MARKKKFIVLARNPKTQTRGLVTGKGHRVFGQKSAMWISDEAEAREIDHQYGMKGSRDVSVTTDQQYEWSLNNEGGDGTKMNNVHHYTFRQIDAKLPDRVSLIGKKKTINGVMYMYTMKDNKLKLEPYQERQRRAKREVIKDVAPAQ